MNPAGQERSAAARQVRHARRAPTGIAWPMGNGTRSADWIPPPCGACASRDPRGPARDELARRVCRWHASSPSAMPTPASRSRTSCRWRSGSLKAIDRYSPERGIPFSSFAVPTILGELKRHFRDTGWSVHVPRDAKELALRVDRASREMAGRLGRSPQVDELAQFLELSVEDVVAALEAANAHFGASLDAPASASDPDAGPLVEMLGSEDDGFSLAETALDLGAAVRRCPTSSAARSSCASARTSSRPRSRNAWGARRCRSRACWRARHAGWRGRDDPKR